MRLPTVLTLTWCLIFIACTSYWILVNNKPPAWDEAHYLAGAESLYQTFSDKGLFSYLGETTTVLGSKAPFISISGSWMFLLFNNSEKAAVLVNIIFYVLFSIFFFLLVSKLHNKFIAFLALGTVSTMPIFFGLARYFLVEFALVAFCFVFLYLLSTINIKSRNINFAVLGVVGGIGLLTKFHFFLFVGLPFSIVFWEICKKTGSGELLKKLSIVGIFCFLISAPWYFRNILTVFWHAKRSANPALLGDLYYGNPLSLDVLTRVFWELTNQVISSYYLISFLILASLVVLSKRGIKINKLLLTFFLLPFLIFFFGPNRDYRLMLPLAPIVAIFMALVFEKVFGKNYFWATTFLILPTLILVGYSYASGFALNKSLNWGPFEFLGEKPYVQKPSAGYSPIVDVLKFVNQKSNGKRATLVSGSEDTYINVNNLIYYSTREKLPIKVKTVSYTDTNATAHEIISEVDSGDFLIIKGGMGKTNSKFDTNKNLVLANINPNFWTLIPSDFTFPDGEKVKIYARKNN